jgi:hypothetical protein
MEPRTPESPEPSDVGDLPPIKATGLDLPPLSGPRIMRDRRPPAAPPLP